MTNVVVTSTSHCLLFTYTLAVPEDVAAPLLVAVSSTAVRVTWTEPSTPNGIILLYRVFTVSLVTGEQQLLLLSGSVEQVLVEELQPYTEYGFIVEACTTVGCNASQVASIFTLESGEWFQLVLIGTFQYHTDLYMHHH